MDDLHHEVHVLVGRRLFFREALAVSPARYLRLRRMSQVRAWLRRGSPRPPSVTEAAGAMRMPAL